MTIMKGYIEACGSIAWSGQNSKAIVGVAAGYGLGLDDFAFAGVEV